MSADLIESLRCQLRRLPPLQDRLGYFGREKSQTENAGDIGPVKAVRPVRYRRSHRLTSDDLTKPLMRACERLDEIGIGLGSKFLLIQNHELGFDASPPKPNRHLD